MAKRTLGDRRKAFMRGHASEYCAALYLLFKGYRIVAMRYKAKSGEIDIIARKRDLVAFIEVKARRATEDAVFAVDNVTQRRIQNASLFWLSRQKDGGSLSLRYDIVAVSPWGRAAHFPDAF